MEQKDKMMETLNMAEIQQSFSNTLKVVRQLMDKSSKGQIERAFLNSMINDTFYTKGASHKQQEQMLALYMKQAIDYRILLMADFLNKQQTSETNQKGDQDGSKQQE